MERLITGTVAGVVVGLFAYEIGRQLQKRFRLAVFNPLLIAIILTIIFLSVGHIDYPSYNVSAKYLSWFLTPATVSLAIPLYTKCYILKRHFRAVLGGILAGVTTGLCSVLGLSIVFGLSHREYVTLLPKSVTTAIGIAVSKELGGDVSLSAAVIIITGILGNLFANPVCRMLRISHKISRGLAIGTSSHAIGTAKAMEMGETEGAMSSLAIVVSGICTVIIAPIFSHFY